MIQKILNWIKPKKQNLATVRPSITITTNSLSKLMIIIDTGDISTVEKYEYSVSIVSAALSLLPSTASTIIADAMFAVDNMEYCAEVLKTIKAIRSAVLQDNNDDRVIKPSEMFK